MSFKFGFYNAIDHDRSYSAEDFGQMFDGLITDGIYSSIGGALAVVAGSGLSVNVRPGRAWFNHTWNVNTADFPIQLDYADLLLPRIDAIVLEIDTRAVVRANSLKRVTGTPATNPVKPTLTKSDGLYQYPLAYVRIPQNSTNVEAANIENCIGNVTPFCTGILKSVSIEELWTQWEAQFNIWFDGVKAALSGDIASNLLNRIVAVEDRTTALETEKVNVSDKATAAQAQAGTDDLKWMTPLKVHDHFNANVATDSEITNNSNVNHFVKPNQLVNKIYAEIDTKIGTTLKTIKLTSGTSWTVPDDAKGKHLTVTLVGGGGGGGSGSYTDTDDKYYGGSGGGAGGVIIVSNYITHASTISYSIGEGGVGGTTGESSNASSSRGDSGGNTSFDGYEIGGGKGGFGGYFARTSSFLGGDIGTVVSINERNGIVIYVGNAVTTTYDYSYGVFGNVCPGNSMHSKEGGSGGAGWLGGPGTRGSGGNGGDQYRNGNSGSPGIIIIQYLA